MTEPIDILKQLRKLRRDLELSQEAVSACAGLAGSGHVSQLEKGHRMPSLLTLTKWAGVFGYEVKLVPKE
jgi:transcriptional regulator with XRE-family HTH domain